jgi:hypothetical protein
MLSSRTAFLFGVGIVLWCDSLAAGDRTISAAKTEMIGRYKVRHFNVREGEAIETERGGVIVFSDFEQRRVAVTRQLKGRWSVGEHSIGNHETLEIVAVDPIKKIVQVRLRTKDRLYPWETSF